MMNYKWMDSYLYTPLILKNYDGISEVGPIIANQISQKIQPIFTKKIVLTKSNVVDYGFACDLLIDNFTIDNFNTMMNEYIDGFCNKLKADGIHLPMDSVEDFNFSFDPFILKYRRFGFFGFISIKKDDNESN